MTILMAAIRQDMTGQDVIERSFSYLRKRKQRSSCTLFLERKLTDLAYIVVITT